MNGEIRAVSESLEICNGEKRKTIQSRISSSNGQAEQGVVVRSLMRAEVSFVGARETESRLVHYGRTERFGVRQSGERLVVANRLAEQTGVAALVGIGGTVVAFQKPE